MLHSRLLLFFFTRCAPIGYLSVVAALSPPQPDIIWADNTARPKQPLNRTSLRCHYPLGRNSREAETRSLHRIARAIGKAAALRATTGQISTFAATQRPRGDAIPWWWRRGWPCPNNFSRPPMLPPCRGGCFRRCCGLAQDAPLPRDAAPPSDLLLQNTLGDPSLAHHPFHGRRVSFGCGGRSARTVPLVDGVRRWRQGQVRLEYRQSRRRQACKRRAADVRGGGRRGRSSL